MLETETPGRPHWIEYMLPHAFLKQEIPQKESSPPVVPGVVPRCGLQVRPLGAARGMAFLPSQYPNKISFLGLQRKFQPSNTWKLMRWWQTVSEWPGIPSRRTKGSTSWCGFQSMVGRPKKWVVWDWLKINPEHFLWKCIHTHCCIWVSLHFRNQLRIPEVINISQGMDFYNCQIVGCKLPLC